MAPRLRGPLVAALAGVLLLAACGDAPRAPGSTDCGDGIKPCACGDTVVADFRLTEDIVCATTHGARVQDLEVRGFARGVVFRNVLRPCASDAECGGAACSAVPAELADVAADPSARWCAGNVAAGVAVRHDAAAFGEQLGLFGFSITADPDAVGDAGGMNLIDGGLVAGIGDRGLHVSQARLNVVRDLLIEGSSRENVHLLRGADENALVRVQSVRAGTGPPNVFVEDSKRNLFRDGVLDGSFVHVVGASDGNRFVDTQLVRAGARYDFETDVGEATGMPRAPRDNLVRRGRIARSGSRALPCVILDGASGTVFDDVVLECGDEPPPPGEASVDVLIARDNPDPARPNEFHVGDCDPAAPDLLVARDDGVSETPLVLEDRDCRSGS